MPVLCEGCRPNFNESHSQQTIVIDDCVDILEPRTMYYNNDSCSTMNHEQWQQFKANNDLNPMSHAIPESEEIRMWDGNEPTWNCNPNIEAVLVPSVTVRLCRVERSTRVGSHGMYVCTRDAKVSVSDRCLQKSAEAERARTLLAFAWWYHTGCGTAVARWLMRGGNWNPLPLPLLSSLLHSLTWVLPLTLSSPWRWRLCLVARVLIKIVSTQQADLELRVY